MILMKRHAPALLALVLFVPACSSSDEASDGSANGGAGPQGGTSAATTGSGGPGGDAEPAAMSGITAAHNAVRAEVNPAAATPLPPLAWSSEVASAAQAHAARCVFEHSQSGYGENIYATSGSATPADVVNSWSSEVEEYDYASNGCSGTCGHYTQVVWAASLRLGCGMADCSENSPLGSDTWQLWVCNYDPPGNYIGQRPY
jgi:pathogenesis-related protein 1